MGIDGSGGEEVELKTGGFEAAEVGIEGGEGKSGADLLSSRSAAKLW